MSMRRPEMRDRRSPMDDRMKGNMRMDRKPNATRISGKSNLVRDKELFFTNIF
jgi:hypothetical protein